VLFEPVMSCQLCFYEFVCTYIMDEENNDDDDDDDDDISESCQRLK